MDQGTWRRLQAIYQAHEQKNVAPQESEQGAKPQPAPPEKPQTAQRAADQAESQSGPPPQREETPLSSVTQGVQEGKSGPVSKSGLVKDMDASEAEGGQIELEGEIDSGWQPRPLQAAWPVQARRLETESESKPENGEKPAAGQVMEQGGSPVAEVFNPDPLEKAMDRVPSGKPSASSVELIPPRRPRPGPAMATEEVPARKEKDVLEEASSDNQLPESSLRPQTIQRAEDRPADTEAIGLHPSNEIMDTETLISLPGPDTDLSRVSPGLQRTSGSETGSLIEEELERTGRIPQEGYPTKKTERAPFESSPASVQRQIDTSTVGESRTSGGTEAFLLEAQPQWPAETVIQRTPSSSPESPLTEPSVQAFVPTEIGPLPADLWDLLDQPRPAKERPAQSQPLVPTGYSPAGSEVKANPATAKSVPPPAASSLHEAASGTVQRRPAESGEVPVQEAHSSAQPENKQEQEINLDELARRVYAEVRARLEMEWERLRR